MSYSSLLHLETGSCGKSQTQTGYLFWNHFDITLLYWTPFNQIYFQIWGCKYSKFILIVGLFWLPPARSLPCVGSLFFIQLLLVFVQFLANVWLPFCSLWWRYTWWELCHCTKFMVILLFLGSICRCCIGSRNKIIVVKSGDISLTFPFTLIKLHSPREMLDHFDMLIMQPCHFLQ